MPFVKHVLVEEYVRLSEKLEVYLAKQANPSYEETIEGIKEDMEFIEKAFVGNKLDLNQQIRLFLKNQSIRTKR